MGHPLGDVTVCVCVCVSGFAWGERGGELEAMSSISLHVYALHLQRVLQVARRGARLQHGCELRNKVDVRICRQRQWMGGEGERSGKVGLGNVQEDRPRPGKRARRTACYRHSGAQSSGMGGNGIVITLKKTDTYPKGLKPN